MEVFPSKLERTAASALLLLSTELPSPPPPNYDEINSSSSESMELSNSNSTSTSNSISNSCVSSTNDAMAAEIRAHQLSMASIVARCCEMTFKVVRKRRSKTVCISDSRKITSGCASETKTEVSASSCLSSGSSAISAARIRDVGRIGKKKSASVRDVKRKAVGSALLYRQAESILSVLSDGCSSEVKIRQLLGDSPDTSKALRMLLKLEKVKRFGAGGRSDPYLYEKA